MNAYQINVFFEDSSLSFIGIGEKNIFRNICLRDIKKEKYNFFYHKTPPNLVSGFISILVQKHVFLLLYMFI